MFGFGGAGVGSSKNLITVPTNFHFNMFMLVQVICVMLILWAQMYSQTRPRAARRVRRVSAPRRWWNRASYPGSLKMPSFQGILRTGYSPGYCQLWTLSKTSGWLAGHQVHCQDIQARRMTGLAVTVPAPVASRRRLQVVLRRFKDDPRFLGAVMLQAVRVGESGSSSMWTSNVTHTNESYMPHAYK